MRTRRLELEEQKKDAEALKRNRLLPELLEELKAECYEQWQSAATLEVRERQHVLHAATVALGELVHAECERLTAGDGLELQPTATGGPAGESSGRQPEPARERESWRIGREP